MQQDSATIHARPIRAMLLVLASAILLTLAFAPFGQWYLAWMALAPWLIVAVTSPSVRHAAAYGFLGGVLFFGMNLWWLWTASIPGLVVLIAYWSLCWAAAAGAIRHVKLGLALRIVLTASIWVALEWLRCNLVAGFPWLPLGVSQTPSVSMCQVADLGGPWIVSFWVALINALAAFAWLNRTQLQRLWPAAGMVAAILALVFVYGVMRLETTPALPGPRVMMVQSNFAHFRGGAPTATPEEVVDFFLNELESQLRREQVDLVVMPEAAFPPINEEARNELTRAPVAPFLERTNQRLISIAAQSGASLLAGGNAVTRWVSDGKGRAGSEIRNAVYYFPGEDGSSVQRYDKIYLVPFSERAPFASGPSWLQRAGLSIAARRAAQPMTAGSLDAFEPFTLAWEGAPAGPPSRLRFITPVCLEAVDARAVRSLMRVADGEEQPVRLIANLSNDGWFAAQEKHQHFQALAFRAIEHRVPIVHTSNTGVSGWIDSTGRARETAPINEAEVVVATTELDDRRTVYASVGDVFAGACIAVTIGAVAWQALQLRAGANELHS